MKIYVLGDLHTVSAMRLAGAVGVVADAETVGSRFNELLGRDDIAMIIITRELVDLIPQEFCRAVLERVLPVLVEIPGISDDRGLPEGALAGIAEALGLPL